MDMIEWLIPRCRRCRRKRLVALAIALAIVLVVIAAPDFAKS